MRLLLDHCIPHGLQPLFVGHECTTASHLGWDRLRNGALLRAAADGGFDVFVTVDRNLKHQQNLAALPITVVVMIAARNDIAELRGVVPLVLVALPTIAPRSLVEIPVR